MNKHNAKDYLPLVQALAEGKVIQTKFYPEGIWHDMAELSFENPPCQYRIKPEPRKAWVWWPALPNHAEYHARIYQNRLAAEQAVRCDGGHITEVTE